ncbi:hypothetical protein [Pseudoleptotrichia goodfellowii]|jgi:hypothetical protein|uniref:Putative CRISPR-associated RAMP protein, Csm4 family n=2 Tax=Pseudoleptotrichia goodfellowii TaxID=157692 RepID=D0GMM6_9FUSO|nr:hypothetical protein [Pseudoleptotrichia goodfellowii]EEY34645.1 putative CRISPR-associated RAMP protein, Csm4 family [Pseudoleptotrichia goodfellowii F0264]BBM36941.1 putative CRISPR-associated RAMP protein, Csm4 family [Pseudoleptotrichia goodfellowii]
MKKYLINLKVASDITSFPDSQKIFGWLIYQIKKYESEENITKLVNNIYEKKIKCMISNVLPKGFIPMPKEYVIDKFGDKSKEIYEKIKKIDFIKKEDMKKILNNEVELKNFKDYLRQKQSYIQKFRLENQFHNLAGLENKAYTVPIVKIINESTEEIVTDFIIMIKTDSDMIIKWLENIKNAQENEGNDEEVYLGPKGSQGYNRFIRGKVEIKEEKNSEKANFYLNVGMLLPNSINYKKSYIDLHISDRKAFEITEEAKKVIGFINVGSVIYSEGENFNIGKSIQNKYNILYKNAIVFGNSYLEALDSEKFGGENE